MQFTSRRRRPAPAIIIVALIDVLIVVLIFMMVTTSFKQRQPGIKLALPESKQPKPGSAETPPIIVTVAKQEPHFHIGERAVTLEKLEAELAIRAKENPEIQLAIRADKDAPFGKIVNVMDAAKAANIRNLSAFTKSAGAK